MERIVESKQSVGEEVANAVSHGIGALLAMAGSAVLIVNASMTSDVMGIVSASVYSFCLVFLYVISTLYHSFLEGKTKNVFQILDHCSIFMLILGTYTPVCLSLIKGKMGWILFGVNLFITVAGIIGNAISIKDFKKLSLVLYIVMGWSILAAIKPTITSLGTEGFLFMLIGGLMYSLGIVFYKLKRLKYSHFIWHLFVLAGSILQYFSILLYLY